jgi:hypothetical protein
MSHRNRAPRDLARAVCSELSRRAETCPPLKVLIELFEIMYYASLKTEESALVSFHMVYLAPDKPDPEPATTRDQWRVVPLAETLPLTISNLIKITNASDSRTSSFAVYHDEQQHLFVWGFVDQGDSYSEYVNYESQKPTRRPGFFHASIAGIGHLVAFTDVKKIAELKVNALITSVSDVLGGGPIRAALQPGITSYLEAVKLTVGADKYDAAKLGPILIARWLQALCRLLLRVQRYGHGGAILISPDNSLKGLNMKYELPYDRLRSALEDQAVLHIELAYASERIWGDYLRKNIDSIPVDLYLDELTARNNEEDNRREVEGTIWFLSLLTRVDGLVLLNQSLELQGFGVEITFQDVPRDVYAAGNQTATTRRLTSIDFNHYGTRHRSMMRYCSQIPGSVGFVISQDKDVRCMTQVGNKLVMWENIKLQLPDFVRKKKV